MLRSLSPSSNNFRIHEAFSMKPAIFLAMGMSFFLVFLKRMVSERMA
jgi:hypothetical protein